MLSVKFLDDHDAGLLKYKKGNIVMLDNYVAEQLQSHNIVEILPDSPNQRLVKGMMQKNHLRIKQLVKRKKTKKED